MITSRTHTAPRTGLPHIYFDEVPYSMAISYTLEPTSLRTDGSRVAYIQEHLHHDFVEFFKVPVGIQEMFQPPLPSTTRNTHATLTCGTVFLIKIMPITSGPSARDLHLGSTSGLHSDKPMCIFIVHKISPI